MIELRTNEGRQSHMLLMDDVIDVRMDQTFTNFDDTNEKSAMQWS